MEKIVEQTLLYDFYGELLTEHQRRIYEDVVLNDYSLSEVAEDLGISRQGVQDPAGLRGQTASGGEVCEYQGKDPPHPGIDRTL